MKDMKKLILSVVLILTAFSCGQSKDELIVTASPRGGVFTNELSVTLKSNKSSTIYYRIVPNNAVALVSPAEFIIYQEPVSITNSSTLEFYGESSESVSRRFAEEYEDSESDYIVFEACVDGSDLLEIVDGYLTITHRNFDEIGKHHECPDNYRDYENGYFILDDQTYRLSDLPIPVPFPQIRDFEVVLARGSVSMNDNAILIDDDEIGSSSMYKVKIYGETLETSDEKDPLPNTPIEKQTYADDTLIDAHQEDPIDNPDEADPIVSTPINPVPNTASPDPATDEDGDYILFEACVDGSDIVEIVDGALIITHRYFDEIGKHHECPDNYRDSDTGYFLLNGQAYRLSDLPISVPFQQISNFEVVSARGIVSINDNAILLDDDWIGSSSVYKIKIYGSP